MSAQLEAQRDVLLEALKAAEPYLRHADVDYNVYVQCRAAIAAVEEEEKTTDPRKTAHGIAEPSHDLLR